MQHAIVGVLILAFPWGLVFGVWRLGLSVRMRTGLRFAVRFLLCAGMRATRATSARRSVAYTFQCH